MTEPVRGFGFLLSLSPWRITFQRSRLWRERCEAHLMIAARRILNANMMAANYVMTDKSEMIDQLAYGPEFCQKMTDRRIDVRSWFF